jgi:hypothetical protein
MLRSNVSMATKKKKSNAYKNTKAGSSKTSYQKKHVVKKVHGVLLTVALVIMAIHGIIAAIYYSTVASDASRPWVISMMVIHSLANIVAAVGIFYWKKWGIYIYAASTIIALVAGMISVPWWSVFYMVLPFVIIGWLLRTKWNYFD